MASLLGSCIPIDCPACETPVTVPLEQVGVDKNVVTVQLDLGPFRAHIADAHATTALRGAP